MRSVLPDLERKAREVIKVNTDGSIQEKNPGGVACWGWIAQRDDPTDPISETGYGIACEGEGATSNVAEYTAVIMALEWLLETHPDEPAEILSDSQLVVYQITGRYSVRKPELQTLNLRARDLLGKLPHVRVTWIPRTQNYDADELSRRAYVERSQS